MSFNLGELQKAKRVGEYHVNCPMCIKRVGKEDTKGRLYINIIRKVFNCFRCKWAGKTSEAGLDEILNLETPEIDKSLDDLLSQLNGLYTIHEPEHFDLEKISWKIDKEMTPIAYNYMISRGFTEEDFEKHNIRVGKQYVEEGELKKRWCGRVMFPYFNGEGKCTYIIGRSYNGSLNRYHNTASPKDFVLYGFNTLKGDTCILCEGFISSLAAAKHSGIPAVAMLGLSIKEGQLQLLRSKVKTVIVSLDGGVAQDIKDKINLQLFNCGFDIYDVSLPGENDPDDLGPRYKEFFDKRRVVYSGFIKELR